LVNPKLKKNSFLIPYNEKTIKRGSREGRSNYPLAGPV
jgi:hypothetical protein